ncbi:MFS general substrate transporter [Sarocladium strictum]
MNAAFDWTGPDDPDNPRNFNRSWRFFITASVTLLAFVATTAGAIYAPAQEAVEKEFDCSEIVAVLPLSMYNWGLAFGPLVGAPLSEAYGRKAVFLYATPIFICFQLGGGFSKNIQTFIICRFFSGMFGSPLISNASATILDLTSGSYRGVALGIYYSLPSFGAVLGPLIGGFVVANNDWRWTQWVAVILTAALYIPICFIRETYKKVVIQRRAIRLGLQDSSSQRTSPGRAFRYFVTVLIQRPLHMLFTEPIVTLISFYNAFILSLFYTFVVSVPWIFSTYYGFGHTAETLSFLGLNIGAILVPIPMVLIDLRLYQKKLRQWRSTHDEEEPLPPENRLFSSLAGSFILPAGMFIVAWTAENRVHWAVPIFFQGVVMLSSMLVYAGATLYVLDAYGPLYGASASGALQLSRYMLSAAFPLFALRMFQTLGVGWALSLLGFITLIMAPIPWLFWYYGPQIRARSRYETSL